MAFTQGQPGWKVTLTQQCPCRKAPGQAWQSEKTHIWGRLDLNSVIAVDKRIESLKGKIFSVDLSTVKGPRLSLSFVTLLVCVCGHSLLWMTMREVERRCEDERSVSQCSSFSSTARRAGHLLHGEGENSKLKDNGQQFVCLIVCTCVCVGGVCWGSKGSGAVSAHQTDHKH